jgi:uncharacterized protein YegP (UPF0339 family)
VPAKFVLRKGRTGKFSFTLVSPTGQTLATSGDYATKRAALAGVQSVQRNASAAAVDDATAPAKKAPARKAAAKKTPAQKTPVAKRTAAKKAAERKSTARKSAARGR